MMIMRMMMVPLTNNDDDNGLIERALFYLFACGVRMCRRRHRRLSGTRVGLAYLDGMYRLRCIT